MDAKPKTLPVQVRHIVANEEKNTSLSSKKKEAIINSSKVPDSIKEMVEQKETL